MNLKEYKAKVNEVNTKFHTIRVKLEKMPSNLINLEKLNRIHKQLINKLKAQLEDDLTALNDGKEIVIK